MLSEKYNFGDFCIDAGERRLSCGDREVDVEPKTFDVILHLVRRAATLVTRNDLLDTVWGHRFVTPSTLNRVITLARRALSDDAVKPKYIVTVHGSGYRYVGPVEKVGPRQADETVRFAPPISARLPARVDDFIGREAELSMLYELVKDHRAVTVLGPGGIGKTQCALELARRCSAEFPDGIWFYDLAATKQADDWMTSLAATLAISTADHPRLLERVLELLQTRCALLVLDNCERVATELGQWVYQILAGTDQVRVLATSQASLNFVGERLMRLPPLALPDEQTVQAGDAESVAAAPAVAMLLARVRSAQPGFHLLPANVRTVAEICRRLDGLPLALELAATRFALLSSEQVLARLEQRFQFLRGAPSGRDPRHQSLLAMLDWSYGLLSPEERRLLSWFSVFVSSWNVEAAIDLCAALDRGADAAVELLTGLVDKSLVVAVPGVMPPRYRLLDMVREYAFRQLCESSEEQRAREAHLQFVVRMCEAVRVDMVADRMRERIEQLVHEHGNIATAVEFALKRGLAHVDALKIVGSLTLYMKAHGAYEEVLRWCRRALERADALESTERGRALLCMGVASIHVVVGPIRVVSDVLTEAARIARLNADSWTESYAHGYQSLWLSHCGEPEAAASHERLCNGIAEQIDDPLLRGLAGLARGWIHLKRGECAAAIQNLRQVRQLGNDLHQRHFIDTYMGLALFSIGEYPAAAAQFRESLLLAAEVGNYRGMAGSIEGCAYIATQMGYYSDAARWLAVAHKIRERTQVPLFSFWRPHNHAARELLLSKLQEQEYSSWDAAGKRMRDDDAANEVLMRLQEFSTAGENKRSGS